MNDADYAEYTEYMQNKYNVPIQSRGPVYPKNLVQVQEVYLSTLTTDWLLVSFSQALWSDPKK